MSRVLITPPATLSYPYLDRPQPSTIPGQASKFSAVLVFGSDVNKDWLQKALVAAAEEAWGTTVKLPNGKTAKMFDAIFNLGIYRHPIRTDAEAKGYPEGSWFISARSTTPPGCVYAWADPETGRPARIPAEKIREELYPGCIVRAAIVPFTYAGQAGKPGISIGLQHLQKLRDGERLDGRQPAEELFTVETEMPSTDSIFN